MKHACLFAFLYIVSCPAGVQAQTIMLDTIEPTTGAELPMPATSSEPNQDWQSNSLRGIVEELNPNSLTIQAGRSSSIEQTSHSVVDSPIYEPVLVERACCEPEYPTVKLTGFFQADSGNFNQDLASRAALGNIQNGAAFRRARLGAYGQAWDNVNYMIEFDFGFPGRPTFTDLYLDIHNVPGVGNLRIGRWRQPFSMDALTSIKGLTFLERALPFAFGPFRQLGIGAYNHTENELLTWAVSGFHFPSNQFGDNLGDGGGYAMASRVTFLAVDEFDGERLLHLGANYSYGDPSNDLVRYRTGPEFFISETGGGAAPIGVPNQVPDFVDTGNISTSIFNLLGVELAAVFGSLYVQSELIYAFVDQINGPSLAFSGMYAHAGYFLTGEVRGYDRHQGFFSRVKPLENVGSDGGIGAWEVAARWSYIDLNDQNIAGNRLQNLTAGVNWHLNPKTRFQFVFIHAFLNDTAQGDADTDILALRAQVDF